MHRRTPAGRPRKGSITATNSRTKKLGKTISADRAGKTWRSDHCAENIRARARIERKAIQLKKVRAAMDAGVLQERSQMIAGQKPINLLAS